MIVSSLRRGYSFKQAASDPWADFRFRTETGCKPMSGGTPPKHTPEGDPILYHGTSAESAERIIADGFRGDNLGYVGFGTRPGVVSVFALRSGGKDGRILQFVLDRNWLAKNALVVNECSHKDLYLLASPEGGSLTIPRSAIKTIRDVTEDYHEGKIAGRTAAHRLGDIFAIAMTETIPLNPQNFEFRHEKERSKVKSLTKALEEGGELPPVLVTEKKGGKYLVLDGHHRVQAAINAGKTEIEAYVVTWKDLKKVLDAYFGGRLPLEAWELDDYILINDNNLEAYSKRADQSKQAAAVWTPETGGIVYRGGDQNLEGLAAAWGGVFYALDPATASDYGDVEAYSLAPKKTLDVVSPEGKRVNARLLHKIDLAEASEPYWQVALREFTSPKESYIAELKQLGYEAIRYGKMIFVFAGDQGSLGTTKQARPTPRKIEILQKEMGLSPEQVEMCIDADPSPNQTDFVVWIARNLKDGAIRLPEDRQKIHTQLAQFIKLRNSPRFTGNRDINSYTPAQLWQLVDDGDYSKKEQSRAPRSQGGPGAKLILDSEGVKVFEVTSPDALVDLSSGTNWCTTQEGHAEEYLEHGPNYVIYVHDQPCAQWDPHTEQLMDKRDNSLLDDANQFTDPVIGYVKEHLGEEFRRVEPCPPVAVRKVEATIELFGESLPIVYSYEHDGEATWANGKVRTKGQVIRVGGGWIEEDGSTRGYDQWELGDLDALLDSLGAEETEENREEAIEALHESFPREWPAEARESWPPARSETVGA